MKRQAAMGVSTQNADQHLYRTIVENSGEAIVIIQNGAIKLCNARAAELCGYSRSGLKRLSWVDLVHPDDREMILSDCGRFGDEPTVPHLLRIHDKAGNLKWLEVHRKSIRWHGAEAVLAYVNDVTERKRLETQFLQSQKMEAVGRLAGGIAHDFNNFLTVILGYTELLERGPCGPPGTNETVRVIREAAKKASTLTQNLLAFSRKQHLELKVIDLNQLVEGMQTILKRLVGENIEIVTRLHPLLGSIHADASQLEQIILNLAVNSKDAMEGGGKLAIATENVRFSEECSKTRPEMRPGRYVMLSISDTGSGMNPETRSHLFEPFYTTKDSGRGTGLGLATVYGIVKQSNGFIYVYSEPGTGTTFKLYFPRIDQKPREGPAQSSPGVKLGGSETILVVEDEQQVLRIIESMLNRKGYTVLAADSGEAAIALSRQTPKSIDLLITDVGIPDMSGRKVWESVKKQHPDSRVLFISGYPQDFMSLGDIGEGRRIFLQKPFGSDLLLRRVRDVLNPS
jgi:PAS domain S-box-containing protein